MILPSFFQTGNQLAGRPSIGSWISYGLGSDNQNLPTFIVLVSKNAQLDQPLYARLWETAFCRHDIMAYSSVRQRPVLFLNNPEDTRRNGREMLEYLSKLNQLQNDLYGDPEIENRIAQYEMAFRMQTSVPNVVDMSNEPQEVFDLYGPGSRDPGTTLQIAF
jgi:hypothetical protein